MTVLGWSQTRADGRVDPGGTSWKSLNGNVPSATSIQIGSFGGYSVFKQGDFAGKVGNSTIQSFAAAGCAVTSLTMAATLLGKRTEHWVQWPDIEPKDLTPPIVQGILKAAGCFQGPASFSTRPLPRSACR